MKKFLAAIRMIRVLFVIFIGTPFVLIASFLPFKRKGSSWAAWITTWMARRFVKIMPLAFECREREKFVDHHGFIFPNHDSYLDTILPMSVRPMRFLAMEEVANYPFIGRVAKSVGTIFVKRENKESRQKAREALAQIEAYPPIILFPEGTIDGDESLSPFRYGAFEIAISNQMAFMPTALIYDPFDVAVWKDESMFAGVWRLAQQTTPVKARLVALRTVVPTADDNAKELALTTHGTIQNALIVYGGDEYKIIQEGL